MKVVILCGGKGTRLREKTEIIPKPMVEIGGKPILCHIMKIYSTFGLNEFVLALGYKADVIKQYFLNYRSMNSDFTLSMGNDHTIEYQNNKVPEDWKITFADTGENSMTGARVAKVAKYIEGDTFLLTYGDGLADIDIKKLIKFHKAHGRIGTLTGVHVPSRFGKIVVDEQGNYVKKFTEKPLESATSDYINGGYFVFQKEFLNYVKKDESCILERNPLEELARDQELMVYKHDGYWQCMDTYRDWKILENLCQSEKAPWKNIAKND